jgi:hypothetical protein
LEQNITFLSYLPCSPYAATTIAADGKIVVYDISYKLKPHAYVNAFDEKLSASARPSIVAVELLPFVAVCAHRNM